MGLHDGLELELSSFAQPWPQMTPSFKDCLGSLFLIYGKKYTMLFSLSPLEETLKGYEWEDYKPKRNVEIHFQESTASL